MKRRFKSWASVFVLVWLVAAPPVFAGDPVSQSAQKALDCGVAEDTVARILAAVLNGRLPGEDGARLLDLLVGACKDGLPAAPLAEKVDEGLSKAVPGDILRQALERRTSALSTARQMVSGKGRDVPPPLDLMMAVVEGLEAGLPEKALAEFVRRHRCVPAEKLATALRIRAYLGRVGMPDTESLRVAETGLALNALTPRWLQFPRLAGLALKKGRSARAISDSALAALQDGKDPQDAAVRLGLTTRSLEVPPSPGR